MGAVIANCKCDTRIFRIDRIKRIDRDVRRSLERKVNCNIRILAESASPPPKSIR